MLSEMGEIAAVLAVMIAAMAAVVAVERYCDRRDREHAAELARDADPHGWAAELDAALGRVERVADDLAGHGELVSGRAVAERIRRAIHPADTPAPCDGSTDD